MAEHPIQGLMNVTMDKIRQMADSNTIIGKPIKTDDGTTILPVSRISFGFASAGTDFDGKNAANKDLFGGGSGAGVNIQPVAFLVVKDGCVRTIQLSGFLFIFYHILKAYSWPTTNSNYSSISNSSSSKSISSPIVKSFSSVLILTSL